MVSSKYEDLLRELLGQKTKVQSVADPSRELEVVDLELEVFNQVEASETKVFKAKFIRPSEEEE
jgi:hypothetical protein